MIVDNSELEFYFYFWHDSSFTNVPLKVNGNQNSVIVMQLGSEWLEHNYINCNFASNCYLMFPKVNILKQLVLNLHVHACAWGRVLQLQENFTLFLLFFFLGPSILFQRHPWAINSLNLQIEMCECPFMGFAQYFL